MEHYFLMISLVFLSVVLIGTLKLIEVHKQNMRMINLEKMHSREIAEALLGKKIDWNN